MCKVSVITPVYNAGSYLEACLESLRHQTYEDIEAILIDDGSTDGSGSLCDEYARFHKRFKVIHQENRGVADATNVGLDNATGSFILFVDSDDSIDSRAVERALGAALESRADIVQFGCIFCDEKGDVTYEDNLENEIIEGTDAIIERYFVKGGMGNSLALKLYDAALFEGVRLDSGRQMADVVTTPRLLAKSKKYRVLDENFYVVNRLETSVSRSEMDDQRFSDYINVMEFIPSFIERHIESGATLAAYVKLNKAVRGYSLIKDNKLLTAKDSKEKQLIKAFLDCYESIDKKDLRKVCGKADMAGFALFAFSPQLFHKAFKARNAIASAHRNSRTRYSYRPF